MPLGRYWATRGKDDTEITEQRVPLLLDIINYEVAQTYNRVRECRKGHVCRVLLPLLSEAWIKNGDGGIPATPEQWRGPTTALSCKYAKAAAELPICSGFFITVEPNCIS